MPAITSITNVDSLFRLAESVELTIAKTMAECGLEVPCTRFVGVSDPPDGCCPAIMVWVDNLRADNTSSAGKAFRCTQQWLVDIHVRVSRCFIDFDEDGNQLPDQDLTSQAQVIYRDYTCVYLRWLCSALTDPESELSECDRIDQGPMSTYATGGCAGFEFTLTVGLTT